MVKFEVISLLISLLAVGVSVTALVRSRKNHIQVMELERVHAELSQKQIDEIEKRKRLAQKADLRCRLEQQGNNYKFIIENTGQAEATNIYFGLDENNEHNPLVLSDYQSKTPYPSLAQGEFYSILATIPLKVKQPVYFISLRWINQDGSQARINSSVSR